MTYRRTGKSAMRVCAVVGAVLMVVIAGGVTGGCGSGSGPTTTTDANTLRSARLVGQWQLTRVFVPYPTGTYTVAAGTERLTFNANGTFTRQQNGYVTEGTYKVDFRKPYSSQSELPVIVYSTTTTADIIYELSDAKLSLSMDAADGGSSDYERVR